MDRAVRVDGNDQHVLLKNIHSANPMVVAPVVVVAHTKSEIFWVGGTLPFRVRVSAKKKKDKANFERVSE